MSDTVIKVENLGKKYIIAHQPNERYATLRDVIAKRTKSIFQNIIPIFSKNRSNPSEEEFWALKDASFEVKRGEAIGIIGRNGAGKSTLLKILSRITEPSIGKFQLKGRVASLLEVGTGFHQELTGRENIFLNGAILGMTHQEIKQKFDEIVDFAEIEKFLDTPVKRYSSGMYIRLAFAVAAHLDPEVLIIDEVLAVGDAAFQKKCIGKMNNIAHTGRTILFVSHNFTAIQNLCTNCLLLSSGRIIKNDSVDNCVREYIGSNIRISEEKLEVRKDRTGNGLLKFTDYKITVNGDEKHNTVIIGATIEIHLSYSCIHPINDVNIGIAIKSLDGAPLSSLAASLKNEIFKSIPINGKFIFKIPRFPFNVGSYFILLDANTHGTILDRIDYAFRLDVETGNYYPNGKLPNPENKFLIDFGLHVEPV
jgi:lipopolysaccharide transport system ATP-binding protein